jgi:hypothetical protein
MHLRKTACILHAALRVYRHHPPLRRGPDRQAGSCPHQASSRIKSRGASWLRTRALLQLPLLRLLLESAWKRCL